MNYNIINYPDGSSYVKMDSLPSSFTHRINSYEDLWTLNQILDVYKYNKIEKPKVIIPCLFDQQADRRFNHNEPHGLKLVLNFLNTLYAEYHIFHPHNPEIVEALLDDVKIIDNSYFIKEVISELYCKNNNIERDNGLFYHQKEMDMILFSSDAGGFKPLMKLVDKINWKGETDSASKSRKWENEKSVLKQIVNTEDFGGKDILIIDDICVRGGTFIGLSKLLKERNAGRLYLAVSHFTLPEASEELLNSFDAIYTTNSKGYEIDGVDIVDIF